MTVQHAVTLISTLQELTEATGTKTTRLQNRVLQSLSDEDLLRVAAELKHRGVIQRILQGKAVSDGNAN